MSRNLIKTGLLLSNLVLGFAICEIKPIQAAEFSFNFSNDYWGEVSGSLSFQESPLRAVGLETITLSALNDYCNNFSCQELPQFNYEIPVYYLPLGSGGDIIQFGSFEDVTFEFNSGYLTGIFLSERQDFFVSGRYFTESEGFLEFSLNGNTYDLSGSAITRIYEVIGTEPVFDEDGNYLYDDFILELVDTFEIDLPGGSGPIDLITIEPVPEPLTVLGTLTAFGFGTMFKRKLSKTAKKNS